MLTLRPVLLLSATAVAAMALAACGGDDDSDATATGSAGTASATGTATAPSTPDGTSTADDSATPSETATASPTGEEGIPFETPSTTFSRLGDGQEVALLKEIRAARNEGFDRVVFEFEGDEVPGFVVEYVDGVTQCGSGEPVELTGEAVVSVRLSPASGHNEAGEATVPQDVPAEGTAAIREVRGWCDFEAIVGYGIGLAGVRPFRVFELEGPPRLVVDFSQ